MPARRKDRVGEFRTALDKNKRIIFKTQCICGICGLPVDMDLKYPDPMSKTVDHIIPIAKGGHPSDLSNLQLAHRCCNRQKSDKLFVQGVKNTPGVKNNPGGQNNPGIQNNPGGQNNPGDQNSHREQNGQMIRDGRGTTVDNDNLPQHADWSTFQW